MVLPQVIAHRGAAGAASPEAGLGVAAWTVDERKAMRKMLSPGVDGIMTNWPDRLIEETGQTASPRPD